MKEREKTHARERVTGGPGRVRGKEEQDRKYIPSFSFLFHSPSFPPSARSTATYPLPTTTMQKERKTREQAAAHEELAATQLISSPPFPCTRGPLQQETAPAAKRRHSFDSNQRSLPFCLFDELPLQTDMNYNRRRYGSLSSSL